VKSVSPLGRGDNAMNSLGRERSFHLVEEGDAEADRVHSVSSENTMNATCFQSAEVMGCVAAGTEEMR
jgi:hypothetical protein